MPAEGWGLQFGEGGEGSVAQDCEGGGMADPGLSPHYLFPPAVLAAPGSVCPTFPASAPLPLVRQTAAPAPRRSPVSARRFLCQSGITDWHDPEGRRGD